MKNLSNLLLENAFITTLRGIWDKLLNFFENSGLTIVKIILLFFLGLFAIRIIAKILTKIFNKTKVEHVISKYLITVIKIILFFVLIISILKMLGIDTTSLIAIITTISLALSLAMENIFSNLANGIIIIMTKPFKEGDWIAISGYEGSVKDIKLLYTVLNTSDNKDISIPNSHFVGNELTNYNANPTRKVIMTFDCSYDSDVDHVKSIIRNCIESNDYAILDPAPVVRLKALEANSLQFQAIVHCQTENYWNLYYDLLDNVFNEFKRENISIPFNQLEVRLLNNENYSPFRQQILPTRTNDGKFIDTRKESDIIDKITDSVNIAKKVKIANLHRKEKKKEKNNNEN